MALDFGAVLSAWPALARGAGLTLLLTGAVLVLATPCAMAVAVGRQGRWRPVNAVLAVLSWIVRGIPPLLLLLIVFFLPPDYGVTLPPFASFVGSLES